MSAHFCSFYTHTALLLGIKYWKMVPIIGTWHKSTLFNFTRTYFEDELNKRVFKKERKRKNMSLC